MLMRIGLFAAAVAGTLLLSGVTPSMAQVDVDIGMPGVYDRSYGDDFDEDYSYRRRGRLKCWEARQILRDRGFYRIVPLDCERRIYTFRARRRGNTHIVKVNSRNGNMWLAD
jgi:hypothetical protein